MSAPLTFILFIAASYLIGSIPFGLLASKLKGTDIREHGSGNIGATNVLRTLGKPIGIAVLILDVLKGFAPVKGAFHLIHLPLFEAHPLLGMGCAIAAIYGHNFPVWLKFKGGKGIATSAGALLALLPVPLGIALGTWIIVFLLSRYVSLASIIASISIPVSVALLSPSAPILIFTIALAALAIWRHHANIKRLLVGTENRFDRKSKSPE